MAIRDRNAVLWDIMSPAAGMWIATSDGYEGPRVRLEDVTNDAVLVAVDTFARTHAGQVKRPWWAKWWPFGAAGAVVVTGLVLYTRKR